MTRDERLREEYWVYKNLIDTLSFDHKVMPKDHFSKELVKVYRESEDIGLKINYFESYFLPLMNKRIKRLLGYMRLLESQEVFELLYDKDIKRYVLALHLSKENNIFKEKTMLMAASSLLELKRRPELYRIISKMNFLDDKENIEKIKQLVRK